MGQPLIAYAVPASVRVYCSRAVFSRATIEDLPLAGDPRSSRIRFLISSLSAEEAKYWTILPRAWLRPNMFPSKRP